MTRSEVSLLLVCFAQLAFFLGSGIVRADDASFLEDVVEPGPNLRDEPFAERFSMDAAVRFLDDASLTWQRDRQCCTCHTNFAYLYARPMVTARSDAHDAVREFTNSLVNERWQTEGPRWDAEVVAAAAALAFNDAQTTGELSPEARTALDRMWESQRDDGGWSWLNCGWPPFEMDDHYGVTLAALAVGVAPGDYASTPAAIEGMEGIRSYFAANPAETLHQETMRLWAASYTPDLMTDVEREACINRLWELQHADGGWSLSSLGNWEREDGTAQTPEISDGYGTGFVIYVLRQAGVPESDPRIADGVAWLKAGQRASGRWFTRSLTKDSHHFITHAGTAFAVMALVSCGE